MGIVNEIFDIMNNICLGPYYFDTAILLRNSYLVNAMLENRLSWDGLTKAEIIEISSVDSSLLCSFLQVPRTIPLEALFLVLQIDDINTIITKRRLLYFIEIMKKGKIDML